jgi:hypothetical protein
MTPWHAGCLILHLKNTLWDSGIERNGNIFYKSTQKLASAGDVDIIGRSLNVVKDTFIKLENKMKWAL